jgi:hypothetical protein
MTTDTLRGTAVGCALVALLALITWGIVHAVAESSAKQSAKYDLLEAQHEETRRTLQALGKIAEQSEPKKAEIKIPLTAEQQAERERASQELRRLEAKDRQALADPTSQPHNYHYSRDTPICDKAHTTFDLEGRTYCQEIHAPVTSVYIIPTNK